MRIRLLGLAALLLLAPCLHADDSSPTNADTSATATAIEVTGDVVYEASPGQFKTVQLGQLFTEGDHLITKDDSGLHLVLADGSSLVLGPNSEITLDKIGGGENGSETFLQLLKGTADAIVQKLKTGSTFELHTPNAVAAVKGTDFEVDDTDGAATVSVREGLVAMSDSNHTNVVDIPPYERAVAGQGYFHQPVRMSSDEIRVFDGRWAHARSIHERRTVILGRFANTLRQRRAALRARRPALRRMAMRRNSRNRANNRANHSFARRSGRGMQGRNQARARGQSQSRSRGRQTRTRSSSRNNRDNRKKD